MIAANDDDADNFVTVQDSVMEQCRRPVWVAAQNASQLFYFIYSIQSSTILIHDKAVRNALRLQPMSHSSGIRGVVRQSRWFKPMGRGKKSEEKAR